MGPLNEVSPPNQRTKYGFEFRGSAVEYFKIWIVNMALSLVTLGIYSAWAKVRKKRYFYGNTFLNESSFEYHGDPIKIFKGRLIFVVLLITYTLLVRFINNPILEWLPTITFVMIFPWLFVRAMIFNLRNSSYRGIHFNYLKNYAESYKTFLLYWFIMLITLGFGTPLFEYKRNQMMVNNTRFGQQEMKFFASPGGYYALWGWTFLSWIALLLLISIGVSVMNVFVLGASLPSPYIAIMIILFYFLFSTLPPAIFKAKGTNLLWNHTTMGRITFKSNQGIFALFQIYFTNFLMTAITLGLAWPWASCRLAHYRAQTMSVLTTEESFDEFINRREEEPTALADAMDDFWDLDIGIW